MFSNQSETPSEWMDPMISQALLSIQKWGRFLSIVGFVGSGLAVIMGLVILVNGSMPGQLMTDMYGQAGTMAAGARVVGFVYLIMGGLYFIPCYYLYQMADRLKAYLVTGSGNHAKNALFSLKSIFRFIGIFTAVILGLYAVLLLFAALALAVA